MKFPALTQIALMFALTLGLMWPVLFSGAPLITDDTASYFRGGGVALDFLQQKLKFSSSLPVPTETSSAFEGSLTEEKRSSSPPVIGLRSLAYSLFVNVSMRAFGAVAPVIVTCALTAWLILVFVERLHMAWKVAVGFGVATLTLLPFHASQISPDIFAAHMILVAMVFASNTTISKQRNWILLGIMYLAILAHYAHIPLGFWLCTALAAMVWVRRDSGSAALMMAPIVLALVSNVAISLALPGNQQPHNSEATATQDVASKPASRISIAPARYPFFLARSLEDGPALKYLTETCPDPRFTICEIYDEFPSNAGAALWGPDSIYNRATLEQARRIADEEIPLVWAAFKAYPIEQLRALLANTWAQFVRIGYPPVKAANVELIDSRELQFEKFDVIDKSERVFLERLQMAALGAAVLMLALNYRVMPNGLRLTVWLVLTSLVVNAVVCGGLSAPVNRYQSRIVWCVVLLGLTAWAIRPRFGFAKVSQTSSNA